MEAFPAVRPSMFGENTVSVVGRPWLFGVDILVCGLMWCKNCSKHYWCLDSLQGHDASSMTPRGHNPIITKEFNVHVVL